MYVYMVEREGERYCGLVGSVSVEDYEKGWIKKHELTI